MIDWKTLAPLPLRRQKDALDRERLADAALKKKQAKHKGRNHWRNWERRQMAKIAADKKQPMRDKAKVAHERYKSAVRAFWNGEIDEHP